MSKRAHRLCEDDEYSERGRFVFASTTGAVLGDFWEARGSRYEIPKADKERAKL